MSENSHTRRRFLTATGVAITMGFAGCSSTSGGGDGGSGGGSHGGEGGDSNHSGDENHSSHGSQSGGSSLDGPSPTATVTMLTNSEGSHFEPHIEWIERGGTVTWKLESGSHTTTAYASENGKPQRIPNNVSAWNSDTLSEQGATFKRTFQSVGVYDYFCAPHETTGMVGTVIVGNPNTEGQPGLNPPQDSLPSETKNKIETYNQRTKQAISDSG